MTPITAKGTDRDKQGRSFVESQSRGSLYTAQEVFLGNSDPVEVTLVEAAGEIKLEYNEITSLGIGTTEIINLTAPAGTELVIDSVEFSGDNKSIFTLEINAEIKGKKRIYYTHYNGNFNIKGTELAEGDNIIIRVENKTNSTAYFNATIKYNEALI